MGCGPAHGCWAPPPILTLAVAAPAARADVLATWGDSSVLSHDVRGVAVAADGDVYVADPATVAHLGLHA